ncbi:MAG: LptF/LptG family permease [Acetobacteraceae bacterium]|nr:LptF/LptG family permease [Acetobacteraceae bacterium]
MRRLTRYVLRQLVLGLVAVTFGLGLLVWLTQSLRFLDLVLNRGLSLGVFLELTLYMLPNFIAVVLPVTTFIVVLAVYHRLENDRELVVMRGAGLGPLALARPALIVAALVAAIGWTMNLWVVPETYRTFREYQFDIRHRMAAVLLQEGVFSTLGDGVTVFVRGRDADGSFRGILLHDARDPRAPATVFAERAWFAVDGGAPRVVLVNGSRQELDSRSGTVRTLSFRENTITVATPAAREEARYREPRERTMGELLFPDLGRSRSASATAAASWSRRTRG